MSATSSPTYEQIYLKAKNGFTGDATVWDQIFQYIRLHPNELFYISPNRAWSIGHQIVYHGNLKLLQTLLSLYNERNPIDIQSKTKDTSNPKTILDIANERKGRFSEQYEYIKHLFDQDKFNLACKTYDWATVDNMLERDPRLLNEKPPYRLNYFIHYLVLYGDVRKLSDYVLRSYQFQFQLKNADDKTPLALAQEQRLDELVEEIQSLIPSDDRESATMNDEREDDRSVFVDSPPTIDNRKSSVPTTVQRVTPQLLKNLTCMLTKQIFVDPVKASDGKTYERNAIIGWLRENRVSPQTGEFIDDILVDDIPTKNLIIQLRQQNLLP
ncbi:unnamed protein product [Rotaria magnacalcarata]|uniref:U-box domain-containing protein n=1 Tax=Rotaria magnacalcarata TaxID=392030 RepID=A0A819Z695_9BILA|nr:unnamed protein product [Rotaria magnacalcarata]CAF2068855.1 unnamed protein product [Rotaria magnacalcarata]CAF3996381.1 unnamed protein product [Rotaria magnacalcarata]CAF4165154.1 unnamed protein product [Rotaria magnacalcarata]